MLPLDKSIRQLNRKRIQWIRAKSLDLMRFLFDRARLIRNGADGHLIFRLDDKFGDTITSTGFLRELKNLDPLRKITVIAGKHTATIYRDLPFIDEIILAKKGLAGTLKVYFKLRSRRFKSIVNTSHIMAPRTLFLTSALKAETKIGFRCDQYRVFDKHVDFDALRDHVTTRYRKTLEALGLHPGSLHYQIHIPQNALARARALLEPYSGKPLIVLNSFAGARLRNLNKRTTLEIVKRLLSVNPRSLIVSIGNGNDLPQVPHWQKELGSPNWVCFPEATDFPTNAALVALADLVISPDTAIVHLASALQKPLVSIYREDTSPEKNALIWAPNHSQNRTLIAPVPDPLDPDINTVDAGEIVAQVRNLLEHQATQAKANTEGPA